jgi:hypothetical protein
LLTKCLAIKRKNRKIIIKWKNFKINNEWNIENNKR